MSFVLEKIKEAAQKRLILEILYKEKDGSCEGWRAIEPYSFNDDDKEFGLYAWDVQKAGIRRFTVERIVDIRITENHYNPRYNIEI
ncbi:MAG: WYL domain-containing protein [Candidatus ainarchaeum sp.]|nr:WYL domain-containing protein [Candidatus ainarchaeum sp.]